MREKSFKNNNINAFFATSVLLFACPSDVLAADSGEDLQAEFRALDKDADASGQAWYDLAQKARVAGEPGVAGQALGRAETAGFSALRVGLEKARLRIAGNEPGEAVVALETVFSKGFTSVAALRNDPVINSLAGRSDYDGLIGEMEKKAYPCEHQAGFGDFDFWIGEWDVHVANGGFAGSNVIAREERGCVLVEHWTGASGSTGMSINYLDLATDEWVQVWNAAGGTQINIRGGISDEGMALEGTIHYISNDTTAPFRGLWTPLPDGRVRQYFEQSNDDGETWTPWFEGFYTRKGSKRSLH